MIGFFRRYRLWILWPITAAVIITMFTWGAVDWRTLSARTSEEVGTILGKTVTMDDLAPYLRGRSRLGEPPETLSHAFWQLAIARFAEVQGFTAHPEYVAAYAQYIQGRQPGPVSEKALALAKQSVITGAVQTALSASLSGSNLECYELFLTADEERQVRYVALAAGRLAFLCASEEISEKEVAEEYEALKNVPVDAPEPGFKTPETVRLELAFLPRTAAAALVTVTAEEVKAEYEKSKETRYRKPPAVGGEPGNAPAVPEFIPLENVASEIKMRLTADRAQETAARRLSDALRFTSDAASHPEDLPTVAKRFAMTYVASAGPFSRAELANVKGIGNLAAAADRLFSATPGTIGSSEVPEGGVLYRVLEKMPAGALPLAEAAPRIREILRAKKCFAKVQEIAEALRTKADETTLEEAVEEQLAAWKTAHVFSEPPLSVAVTEFFKARDASISGVGNSEAFRRQAFALPSAPSAKLQHAAAIDNDSKTAFVLAVAASRPPDPRGFAVRKEDLRRQIIRQKGRFLFDAFASGMRRPDFAEFTYQGKSAGSPVPR